MSAGEEGGLTGSEVKEVDGRGACYVMRAGEEGGGSSPG